MADVPYTNTLRNIARQLFFRTALTTWHAFWCMRVGCRRMWAMLTKHRHQHWAKGSDDKKHRRNWVVFHEILRLFLILRKKKFSSLFSSFECIEKLHQHFISCDFITFIIKLELEFSRRWNGNFLKVHFEKFQLWNNSLEISRRCRLLISISQHCH